MYFSVNYETFQQKLLTLMLAKWTALCVFYILINGSVLVHACCMLFRFALRPPFLHYKTVIRTRGGTSRLSKVYGNLPTLHRQMMWG